MVIELMNWGEYGNARNVTDCSTATCSCPSKIGCPMNVTVKASPQDGGMIEKAMEALPVES